MYILIIGFFILLAFSALEYYKHQKYRKQIPMVIHVNGTRGKSSVTRLIAAGLREGGKKVIAKTTGSAPRLIFEDGNEIPIKRPQGPNIREQLSICKFAAKRGVDVLVLECMAVMPEYQWITEHKMVKSSIGVITNIRLDHVDVMGPGIKNCTYSICNTIPSRTKIFTSEKKLFPYMKKISTKNYSEIHMSDESIVKDNDLEGFSYLEHKDNIALSLNVCNACGVNKDIALRGMKAVTPDIGATKTYQIKVKNKDIYFAHSFAANDPESTEFVIKSLKTFHPNIGYTAFLLNTRADRMFRSKQLIEMLKDISYDALFLIGHETQTVYNYAQKQKLNMKNIHNLGWTTGEKIIDSLEIIDEDILLIGIGNIGGNGRYIVEYFKEKSGTGE
ncbi:MAG TPA: poly-gamma-glutamate synthase PgsB [Candidatus Cloacimonetes bacterium]|nr:poly-gamma-glutamate synthase PgsB [Candidatus Cloacimonadota bacterium]HEX38284.1 poly-gamma-glutamate synthase PgsB [Candidatus Cloacimonadota bacterium]